MAVIGIPKEIKEAEYRVGATPAMCASLVNAGHKVLVQHDAGAMIGFLDSAYAQAGVQLVASAREVFTADIVIKVKEPQASEFPFLHEGQVLFTFLHLAPDPELTKVLLEKKVVGIAYETVTDNAGRLPLLRPMSEIAGRISIQAGATCLQMIHGGKGVVLGGVPGVLPAKVVVIGGGVVGTEASRVALGFGADVTVLDTDVSRLQALDISFGPHLKTLYSSQAALTELISCADLVIGAVLIPGKRTPKLIQHTHLKRMTRGSVIVDVAIDQGGVAESSHATSHAAPTYIVDGIVHYCVPNMPGACARTSTLALTNSTCDYALKIANMGYKRALREDKNLACGLNVCLGKVTHPEVAHELSYPYQPVEEMLV